MNMSCLCTACVLSCGVVEGGGGTSGTMASLGVGVILCPHAAFLTCCGSQCPIMAYNSIGEDECVLCAGVVPHFEIFIVTWEMTLLSFVGTLTSWIEREGRRGGREGQKGGRERKGWVEEVR